MSDEHTPGPWKQSGRMVIDTVGDAVAMVNIARPVANAYADAALIASAPDLAARVRELEAERDALRALLRDMRAADQTRGIWLWAPRIDAALAGEKP